MVGAGDPGARNMIAGKRAQPPLHPVADDGVANLLGNREADPHLHIVIAARADLQDETGHRNALGTIGGQEIRTLRQCNDSGPNRQRGL